MRPEAEGCAGARRGIGVSIIATGTAEDVGEVDVVENVEGFRTELRGEPFAELEFLGDRKIPFVEGEPAEVVATGVAKRAIGRRKKNGASVGIAA